MPYFLHGSFWDQNLCCDEKCLRKALVMKNMSIFQFKYISWKCFLIYFLYWNQFFFKKNLVMRCQTWKGITIVDGLKKINCIFATWTHVKRWITTLFSFAPNPSMNSKHFNFEDHSYLHLIMCSHPSIIMNNKQVIT